MWRVSRAHLVAGQLCEIAAVEMDGAAIRIDQPHDTARERGLARAGFANDAERRAFRQCERHVLHGVRDALAAAQEAAGAIGLRDVLDGQDRLGARACAAGGALSGGTAAMSWRV